MSLTMQAPAEARDEKPSAPFPTSNVATMKLVYTVVDRGNNKSFWTRVGAAFLNRDGSWTVRLDAVPINGVLQLRDWTPRDDVARGPNGSPASGGFGAGTDIPF